MKRFTVVMAVIVGILLVVFVLVAILTASGMLRPRSSVTPAPTATPTKPPEPTRTVAEATATTVRTPTPDMVTLRAAPSNSVVLMFGAQMVAGKAVPQDQVTATYPSGTQCRRVEGPTSVTVWGVSMQFYLVSCDGKLGFVNARWVVR